MLSFYLMMLDDESDKKRFEEIYCKYKAYMSKIALSMSGDEISAMDSVHNAFISIAKVIDKLPADMDAEHERRYVRKVIINAVANERRRKRAEKKFLDANYGYICEEKDPEDDDRLEELVRFISDMSPIYRDVLTLHYLNGMKTAEIAEAFDLPFTTVHSRLTRGTALLKKKVEETYSDD